MLHKKGTITIPAGCTVCVEINAGEEMTGFLSLQLKQGAGAEVKILTSECYVEKEKGESDHPMRLPKRETAVTGKTES